MWSTEVRDTQTGELVQKVAYDSFSWGKGDLTTRQSVFPLPVSGGRDRAYWRSIFYRAWDHQITHLWDGVPVTSQLIMGRPKYSRAERLLTVSHVDPGILLDRRWPHGVGTSAGEGGYYPDGVFVIENKSLEGALIEVLRRAFTAPIVPKWPIAALVPAAPSGSFSKTWPFYNFENLGDMADTIMKREDGPEWDARPVMIDDRVFWQIRVGTALGGPSFEWNLAAPDNPVTAWDWQDDDSESVTAVHYPGKGSEKKLRVGAAFLPGSAGLARDTIGTNRNEADIGKLSAEARGIRDGRANPVAQWSLTVNANRVHPADVQIGSSVRLLLWDDDPWLPPMQDTVVVGMTGTDDDEYQIEVAEV